MNKGAKDIVIDLDEIVASISGVPSHDWSRKKYAEKAFSKRNQMLSSLSMDKVHRNYDHAWFIVSEPEAFRRSWWEMKLNPEMIIVLETSEQQCLKNADLDSDRNRQETALAINKWWNNYTPRNGDVIFRQT
ncbi:hypothetical protein [Bartonella tamiae]|nr:hypothetical protein [Bartonella tamiae]